MEFLTEGELNRNNLQLHNCHHYNNFHHYPGSMMLNVFYFCFRLHILKFSLSKVLKNQFFQYLKVCASFLHFIFCLLLS